MTERTVDPRLLEANHRRVARLFRTWPKWMQDVTLTKYSVRPEPERCAAAAMAEGDPNAAD